MSQKIYDIILKIIITAYLSEFLAYIGIDKTIEEVLKTEITTLSGRTVYLDFLCRADDRKLYNIEFQLKGPYPDDLNRFYDYNIIAHVRYDTIAESVVVSFRTKKSGEKEIKISDSVDFHPKFFYLGDVDYEKILNNLEYKINHNSKLTSFEEISLLIMTLLPKYKNKTEMLKRICNVIKKRDCFNPKKIDMIESLIQMEIDRFVSKTDKKEFKEEIDMTPETQAIFIQAIEETNKKYAQLEKDAARREGLNEGRKEGRKEEKENIARSLKGTLTDEEISKHTGLSLETIEKL